MYAPPLYRWTDEAAALRLAGNWNFATLITVADGAPLVSHLPFLVDETRRVLRGHLARANPHSAKIEGADHIALFTGPHAYISPDWYGEKSEDVPTWNYLAVHVAGKGRILTDASGIDVFLADLSAHEETRRPDLDRGGKVWTLDKVPPEKHARMRAAIVAFEIDIASVEAKAKLSQNKQAETIQRVIDALSQSSARMNKETARFMKDMAR